MIWRIQLKDFFSLFTESFGEVHTVEDLYAPSIFGGTRDLACECGKYVGRAHEGRRCEQCRVWVRSDAKILRNRLCGGIRLATGCLHPLGYDGTRFVSFPIAPIAYRTDAQGKPNALGKKYEELVRRNNAILKELPPFLTEEHFLASCRVDPRPLEEVLNAIVGVEDNGKPLAVSADESHTLLGLLLCSIASLDPDVAWIVHSMGCDAVAEGRIVANLADICGEVKPFRGDPSSFDPGQRPSSDTETGGDPQST